MKIVYILLLLLSLATFISIYFFIIKPYSTRYRAALADIEEAFTDIIRATNIIMSEHNQHNINLVIYESIRKNVIVERIFRQRNVLCIRENSREWIMNEVYRLQNKYDI